MYKTAAYHKCGAHENSLDGELALTFFCKFIVSSMRVEEQTDKKVRNEDVEIQKEGVSKTTKGGTHPKSDIKNFLGPGSGDCPEGPQTITAKTLVGYVGPKYAESEEKWQSVGRRSSQQWRS